MAANKQLWTKDFAANLYDEKAWYTVGKNFDQYVSAGICHIPQATAGIVPIEITSATALPLSVTERTYDDLTYTMKMIAASPRYVRDINAVEASFDTRSAEMKEMLGSVRQAMQIEIADKWCTTETGSVIRTSGTSTRTNLYGLASVKRLTFNDILTARAMLIKSTKNVDLNNLYLVVDPILYNDLIAIGNEFVPANQISTDIFINGFVGTIGGFKVIQRGVGIPYTNATTKAAINYGDAHSNTTLSSALALAGDFVAYSKGTEGNGEIRMGIDQYATGYYGDILQGHTRVGASPMYAASSNIVKGVVSIIEEV